MATNVRFIKASAEQVFAVLADGWLYPGWVVGASRMRAVDDRWPAAGSQLHHSFGTWPALLDDRTEMLEWDPPRRAVMQAHGWPIGEARVVLEAKRKGDGCLVRISEDAVEGPGTFVPRLLREPALKVRNSETLQRLAYLAEGGAGRS